MSISQSESPQVAADPAPGEPAPMPLGIGSDTALVEALVAGDMRAKAVLFERYAPTVERFITRLIGFDRELADILQEVFVHAFGSIRSLRNPAALKSWLLSIATYCARRALRSRSRRAWLHFFVDSEEEAQHEPIAYAGAPDAAETVRAVYHVLRSLPANERIVFALRYIDGMTLAEIAAACAVSIATVKRRLRSSEQRFVKAARRQPLLENWLEGSRWQEP